MFARSRSARELAPCNRTLRAPALIIWNAAECERLAEAALTDENRNILLDFGRLPKKASSRLIRGSSRGDCECCTMDKTPRELRARITHLHQLADGVSDQQVKDAIAKMIDELEQRLHELENKPGSP